MKDSVPPPAEVSAPSDSSPIGNVRFVSVDTESTGLDPKRDFLVAYGAVAVMGGEILLDDAFEALVRRPFNDANVTLHGITREASQEGLPPETALAEFLDYARGGVWVGHHIGHDIAMISAASERFLGAPINPRFVDTMELALHLERDGVLPEAQTRGDFTLDGLCARFGIAPHGRHTAVGDAFLTAQVFLRLLRLAKRAQRTTLAKLCERWQPVES